LTSVLQAALSEDGHELSSDPPGVRGVEWAKSIEARIRSADTVVVVVSDLAADDDLVQYQLEVAVDERRKRGLPQILPVWLNDGPGAEGTLGSLKRNLHYAVWRGSEDNQGVVSQVRAVLASGQSETEAERLDTRLQTPGGAVAVDSRFYVRRRSDDEFEEALKARESVVLVKGPRQIGKSSLVARGIELVRDMGWRCATTDFQQLSSRQLESEDAFYRVVVTTICRQLDFKYDMDD
jgi:hypothetical protein